MTKTTSIDTVQRTVCILITAILRLTSVKGIESLLRLELLFSEEVHFQKKKNIV